MNAIKKISKKSLVIFLFAVLIIIGAATFIGIPSDMQSFTYQGTKYGCGKQISGQATLRGFIPNDQQEVDKFCRNYDETIGVPDECTIFGPSQPSYCAVIEYRAVIDILKRDDVATTIDKYATTQASVKALGHKYIHDKEYLKRILPAYSDVKIDCIIVVHSPEGSRFFIKNGEVHKSHDDHQYLEISSEEFLASLNKASDLDVSNFWLGLH